MIFINEGLTEFVVTLLILLYHRDFDRRDFLPDLLIIRLGMDVTRIHIKLEVLGLAHVKAPFALFLSYYQCPEDVKFYKYKRSEVATCLHLPLKHFSL